jgi:hypothetical protein
VKKIKLTESQLTDIISKVLSEQSYGEIIKEWENSMKKRNDIEFLRIEKTEALPNNKLMVYYAYNPIGKDEFKGTKISTDVIKFADGGMFDGIDDIIDHIDCDGDCDSEWIIDNWPIYIDGIDGRYTDNCDRIKACLHYASRQQGENWYYFKNCMMNRFE